jgi:hypothetical protein
MSSSGPSSFSRPWTANGPSRPTTARSTRPWTAQSRPQTAVSTVQPEGNHIIALLEGRGVSRETGIAALNRDTGQVTLVQVNLNGTILWLRSCGIDIRTRDSLSIAKPGRGLPDLREDPSPNAPPLSFYGACTRHILISF